MADEITPRRDDVPPGGNKPSLGGYNQEGGNEFQVPERNYTYRDVSQGGGGGGGGENNPLLGWLIFILIFGVGNAILYSTTGIFFIPIPRR